MFFTYFERNQLQQQLPSPFIHFSSNTSIVLFFESSPGSRNEAPSVVFLCVFCFSVLELFIVCSSLSVLLLTYFSSVFSLHDRQQERFCRKRSLFVQHIMNRNTILPMKKTIPSITTAVLSFTPPTIMRMNPNINIDPQRKIPKKARLQRAVRQVGFFPPSSSEFGGIISIQKFV